jgi:hypothetical protein
MLSVPSIRIRACVEQQCVVDRAEPPRPSVGEGPLPHDLVSEVLRPEHRIEESLEVVAGRRIAMEIQPPRRFQHPPKLDQPRGHHRQIREHVARAERDEERLHDLGYLAACLHDLLERLGRREVPPPRVLERLYLGRGPLPRLLGEQDVVVLVRLERRVEVDEAHRLVFDVVPEHVEVVTIVEEVRFHPSMPRPEQP